MERKSQAFDLLTPHMSPNYGHVCVKNIFFQLCYLMHETEKKSVQKKAKKPR
jgi:hypothetical protein